jgi:ABC-type transporter Mla MlaB component
MSSDPGRSLSGVEPVSSTSIVIAVRRAAARAGSTDDIRIVVLEAHHRSAPGPSGPEPLQCDVGTITQADEATLDALARLQLAARRLGTSIELTNAGRALRDLLDLAGLADVLPDASGVEVDGQVEDGEQLGVDEEVDPGDAAV